MNKTDISATTPNSTMKLARTSSAVKPPAVVRHNLSDAEKAPSAQPVTLDYLEGFASFS
jgi:hypothetical protein